MKKSRLEAFSDGVLAIIITIMVLEIKLPRGDDVAALRELSPVFVSYLLSFIYVGIYWNNHHHMLQTTRTVNGGILWGNLHLLFWLSLVPALTRWMGENHFSTLPVALYGANLLLCGLAYYTLSLEIIRHQGAESVLKKALGRDEKGIVSLLIYSIAVPMAFWNRWISLALYVVVAILWLVPDTRIEKLHIEE